MHRQFGTLTSMTVTAEPVGQLVRQWRERRHRSQLDVSIAADVSARHLSFIETGRSVPSRAMIERLCDELGLLRSPGERLGMLFGQRWRAARIVIDMGLHLDLPIPTGNGFTDETRWTPELGVAVLRAASGAEAAAAKFEVDRYFGWPAQALAFRVGARLWRQVRAEAERAPDFDLREFHMRALRMGPMGLGPLREVLIGGGRD